jgi:hypothetical protein
MQGTTGCVPQEPFRQLAKRSGRLAACNTQLRVESVCDRQTDAS